MTTLPRLQQDFAVKAIFASDLRGHAYIKARGLSPKIVAAHQHTCESCRLAEELPRVQRLVENWKGEEA